MESAEKHPGPFFHPGGKLGVLMLHGFTGSAYVFEDLAAGLAKEHGYTTYACLLRGHGTSHIEMEKTGATDWLASAEEAYDKLRESGCERIAVIGASFGGMIAASLSLRRPVSGIVMIGTPLRLEHQTLMDIGSRIAPLLGKKYYTKGSTKVGVNYYENSGNDLGAGNSVFAGGNHSYRHIPLRSVRELLRYLKKVPAKTLPQVSVPVLLIQSRNDGLVRRGSEDRLMSLLGTKEKTMVWTTQPHHNLRKLLATPEIVHEVSGFLNLIAKP